MKKLVMAFAFAAALFCTALIGAPQAQASTSLAYMKYDAGAKTLTLTTVGDTKDPNCYSVTQTGYTADDLPEWVNQKLDVEKVIFDQNIKDDDYLPIAMSYWFYNMKNLTEIVNIDYLDTKEVVNMRYTFAGCSSLESIDFSSWSTEDLRNVTNLFDGCSGLEEVNLPSMPFMKVTQSQMFQGCDALSFITVPQSYTFDGGTGLSYTGTWYGEVDEQYSEITSPSYTSFNEFLSKQPAGSYVSFIKEGYVGVHVKWDQINSTLTAEYGAIEPALLGKSVWPINQQYTPDNLPGWVLASDASQATTFVFATSLQTQGYAPDSLACWFYNLSKLTTISNWDNLDVSKVTDIEYMFYKASGMVNLTLPITTAAIINADCAFQNMYNLEKLDISKLSFANNSRRNAMFNADSRLNYFAAPSSYAFDPLSGFDFKNTPAWVGWDGSYTASAFSSMEGKNYSEWNEYIAASQGTATFSREAMKAVAMVDSATNTLNFTEGLELDSSIYPVQNLTVSTPAWIGPAKTAGVTTVIFDHSLSEASFKPTSTANWLSGLTTVTAVEGLSNLDTSTTTDMDNMFKETSVSRLDLQSFSTAALTSMQGMFEGCTALTSLNLASFDLSQKATLTMQDAFRNDTALTSFTVPATFKFFSNSGFPFEYSSTGTDHWDAKDSAGLAQDMSSRKDMDSWNTYLAGTTGIVYFMVGDQSVGPYMHLEQASKRLVCSYGIITSDPSNYMYKIKDEYTGISGDIPLWRDIADKINTVYFDTTLDTNSYKPTSMAYWFSGLNQLKYVYNFENINETEVTSYKNLFSGCESLQDLNLSKVTMKSDAIMTGMFTGCSSLKTITLPRGFAFTEDSGFAFGGISGSFWIVSETEKMPSTADGWNHYLSLIGRDSHTFYMVTTAYTFDANGGTFTDGRGSFELYGDAGDPIGVIPHLNNRDGFTFEGWFVNDEKVEIPQTFGDTSQTYLAKWFEIPVPPSPEPTHENGWSWEDGWRYYVDGNPISDGWHWFDDSFGAHWYFFNESGYADKNQWKWDDGWVGWYYLNDSCYMVKGIWSWIDNEWYGFNWDGKMCTGWVWDSDWSAWFYCYPVGGVMARDTWIGDYWVNNSGMWSY